MLEIERAMVSAIRNLLLMAGVLFLGIAALSFAGVSGAISQRAVFVGVFVLVAIVAALWMFLPKPSKATESTPSTVLGFVRASTKVKIVLTPLALIIGLKIAIERQLYAEYAVAACIAILWLYLDIVRINRL
jgi:hypothetical protein